MNKQITLLGGFEANKFNIEFLTLGLSTEDKDLLSNSVISVTFNDNSSFTIKFVTDVKLEVARVLLQKQLQNLIVNLNLVDCSHIVHATLIFTDVEILPFDILQQILKTIPTFSYEDNNPKRFYSISASFKYKNSSINF